MTKISKFAKAFSALTVMSSLVAIPASADTVQFTDIGNLSAESQAAINYLQANNILHGVGDGKFDPSGTLTRAQFATMMVYALGLPVDTTRTKSQYFSDVTGWASGYVDAAKVAGLIDGVGNGQYEPNTYVNREQVAKILVCALQMKYQIAATAPLTFTDVTDSWAQNYVALAEKYNLVTGVSSTQFAPTTNATREIAADFTYRLVQTIKNGIPSTTPTVTAVGYANANNTVTVYGSTTNANSVKISMDGGAWATVGVTGNGTYSFTTSVLQQGTHSFSVESVNDSAVSTPTTINVIVGNGSDTPTVITTMTNPDISKVTVTDSTHVQVYFTRQMDPTTTSDVDNYTVSGGIGVSSAVMSSNNEMVTLTLDTPFSNQVYYTVLLSKDILDATYNPLSTTTDYVTGIYWDDETAPTVQSVQSWYNGSVKVTFSKPLGTIPAVVLNGTHVTVDGFTPGNNYVTISKANLPTSISDTSSYVNIIVSGAEDESVPPNTMTLYSGSFRYYQYYQTPVVGSITPKDEKTLVVTFNEPLQNAITDGVSDNIGSAFTLTATENGNVTVDGITATTTDGQTFTLTLPDVYSNLNLTSATLNLTFSNFSDPGNDLGATTTRSVTVSEDRTPPTLVSETYTTDNKIVFNFSEPLSPIDTSALANSLVLTNSSSVGYAVTADEISQPAPNAIAIDNSELNLVPGSYSIMFPANVVHDNSIRQNGNAQVTRSFTVPSTTSTTGTTVSVSADDQDVIKVAYSTQVTVSAINRGNYLLNGVALPVGTLLSLDPSQTTVTIAIPKNTIAKSGTDTFRIANVYNLDKTLVPTTTQLVNIKDNTAPTIKSATVDPTTGNIVVTFSEDINGLDDENPGAGGATMPAGTDFIITSNGNAIDPSSIHVAPGANEEQIKISSSAANFLSGSLKITISSSTTGADAAGNMLSPGQIFTVR